MRIHPVGGTFVPYRRLLTTLSTAVCAALTIATLLASFTALRASTEVQPVQIIQKPTERRVDILIGGKPFTSYIYPKTLKKPVLFPLRAADGLVVTRGFPLEPRPGERVDHPHHAGLWFNYGNVNGFDFWNNSDAIKPADRPRMGVILQRSITSAKGGRDKGVLEVETDWQTGAGKIILHENTRFVFRGGPTFRSIDRITTLHALDEKVVFKDDKEGVFGMRVARQLEGPSNQPEVFTDAQGRPTTVAKMDNAGVNGVYETSEGVKGDAVWGTRGRWCMLSGKIGGDPVTIAILDNPKNPGFPTYWHARTYGLFAANPLGQKIFSKGKQELNFTLEPGQSTTFRYRVLLLSKLASPADIESAYNSFVGDYK